MTLLRWLSSYGRNLLHKSRLDQELDEELRSYVEMLTGEKIAQGIDADEARRAALIEVGGIEQVKEQVRDGRTGAMLEILCYL
jgi:putative ABC transport system permease protein